MRRAFIFTTDAIFSLMILASVSLLFTIYSSQPEYSDKTTFTQALAYDYASLSQPPVNLDAATFKSKTGLDVYTSEGSVPSSRQNVVRATKYSYNNSCSDKDCGTSCRISKAEATGFGGYGCLTNQELERFGIISSQALVSAP